MHHERVLRREGGCIREKGKRTREEKEGIDVNVWVVCYRLKVVRNEENMRMKNVKRQVGDEDGWIRQR